LGKHHRGPSGKYGRAYDKVTAVARGHTEPHKGCAPPGVEVKWVFEGVSQLLPIYEEIEDGSELMWSEYTRKLKNVRKKVRTKGQFHQKPRSLLSPD
jgi:hypothetical protein